MQTADPILVGTTHWLSKSQSDLELTPHQKEAMVSVSALADKVGDLNKKIRAGLARDESALNLGLTEAWGIYEDLLSTLRDVMLGLQKGTPAFEMFKSCHDCYFSEFNSLKVDVNEIFRRAQARRVFLQPTTQEEEAYTDLLTETRVFEENNLTSFDPFPRAETGQKNLKTYYSTLIGLMRKSLNFIKKVFFIAETTEEFGFLLTPLVRVRWAAMMAADKTPNKEEIHHMSIIETKSRDLLSLLSASVSEVKNKRNTGQDLTYERIDIQNKFSMFTKNLCETLSTRELTTYNITLSNKCGSVIQGDVADEKSSIFSMVSNAIKGEEMTFVPLQRNKYLATLYNICNNCLEGLSLIDSVLDFLTKNAYELTLYINFVKKYALKLFLIEAFHKLDKFNEHRRKGLDN